MFNRANEFVAVVVVSTIAGFLAQQSQVQNSDQPAGELVKVKSWETQNPADVLGYENCRKCHLLQIQTLETTAHFRSFETMHRTERAKEYCRKLGLRSVKRSERCVRCHYTPEVTSKGRTKAQSGISCESCHGPAKNWVQGHNDYGGLSVTKETETKEHKAWRVESSIDKGMRHPSNLYLVARSCYDCHLVDDSELVNVTGHPTGTLGFNMVAWSQGSMRHNWHRTNGKSNEISSPERLRVMFVVDLLTRLEYLVRARTKNQVDTNHFKEIETQIGSAVGQLREVVKLARLKQDHWVVKALAELDSGITTTSQESQLRLAGRIGKLAYEFAKNERLHQLEAIQPILPNPKSYR